MTSRGRLQSLEEPLEFVCCVFLRRVGVRRVARKV